MPDQEDYGQAELRVNRLLFCAIEPPDPGYPFAPDGSGLWMSGDYEPGNSEEILAVTRVMPADASFCRLFVEDWNSFIYLAGSDVQLRWNLRDAGGSQDE